MSALPLSRDEFADALRKGKGRAMQHIRAHGDAGVEDLLLEACLHDLCYDKQCEDSRGGWLSEMLAALPDGSRYHAEVLSAFGDSKDEDDVRHMAGIVRRLAEGGDQRARGTLYEKFEGQEFGEWTIAPHLVQLDGREGLATIARGLGQRLEVDSELQSWYRGWIDEELGAAVVDEVLALGDTDPDIARFRAALMRDGDESEPQPRMDLDEFLAAIAEGRRRPRIVARSFARKATEEELQRLLEMIEHERDSARLTALLNVFGAAAAPGGSRLLLDLARSDDMAVRSAAIEALARLEDKRIEELSMELLASGSLVGVELMELNGSPDQFRLLLPLLPGSGEPDKIHALAMDLNSISKGRRECEPVLRWVYENTPCSLCRGSAVRELVELKCLPEAIAAECRDDCTSEARELVATMGDGNLSP